MYTLHQGFEYVVIDTGYTSRLWNEADSNGNSTINTDHRFFEYLDENLYDFEEHAEHKEGVHL